MYSIGAVPESDPLVVEGPTLTLRYATRDDAPRLLELASDADLSDRLRELSAVRDLVAGLGRPAAPRGLARETLGRIAGRQPARCHEQRIVEQQVARAD